MSKKSRINISSLALILLGYLISACSPSIISASTLNIRTETPEPTLVISLPTATRVLPKVTTTAFATSNDESAPTPNGNQNGLIALVDQGEESKILIIGSNGQPPKAYSFTGQAYTPWKVEQVNANCEMITLVKTDNGQKLIPITQNGKMKQEIFFLENNQPDTRRFLPTLSQTGKFIAYVVFSGELYYDTAQHQDVELVSLDNIDHAIRLTTRGGAWKEGGAWSLDGTQIAYTDYDEKDVLQVYITQPINEMAKKQVSQFSKPGEKPAGPLIWSADGKHLVLTQKNENDYIDVWIASTEGIPAFKLNLPDDKISIVESVYWSADETMLLLYIGNYSDMDGLYWFDLQNNGVIHKLTSKEIAQSNPDIRSLAYVFPFSNDLSRVIFHNSVNQWYIYDTTKKQIQSIPWLSDYSWGSHVEISTFPENLDCAR